MRAAARQLGEGRDNFRAALEETIRRSELTGTVKLWAVATAPKGWLDCNGAAISRLGYAALFAVIGTTHGVGDGSTTFNLPSWTAPTGGIYIIKV